MKIPVLAALTCIALAALPVMAAPITFNATGASVVYTVPVTGQYTITAVGAKGGDGVVTPFENGGAGAGGLGAEAGGTFFLTQGERLEILVGAAGSVFNYPDRAGFAGGGGGGSFVAAIASVAALSPYVNLVPLVVGGGGGGGGGFAQGFAPSPGYNGGDGLIGPDGGDASVGSGVQAGGLGGHGGNSGTGGRFLDSAHGNAGLAFNDLAGGVIFSYGGAAGGGGQAGSTVYVIRDLFADSFTGGGGGGGYSGGGGGGVSFEPGVTGLRAGGGGGGGSFTAGADPVLRAGVGTGDGFVTITPDAVAVPEPGALALFGMGLFGLFAVRQARRR